MLLALFLVDLAGGLYLFLPLVGRRNAGVKFYRLVLITNAVLMLAAAAAHYLAHRSTMAALDGGIVALIALVYFVLRYPKRLVYRGAAVLLAIAHVVLAVAAWKEGTSSTLAAAIAGSISSTAILGSVSLAMLLGHWYLVVRGMSIDPLKRLTMATLAATILKLLVVSGSLLYAARLGTGYGTELYNIAVGQGIFFWMRVGWGLIGPLVLYPMVWGTVRIRSTMAATGILYVDMVAVIIGEVLGGWLSAGAHLPI